MWGKGKRRRLRAFARENSNAKTFKKKREKLESTLGYYIKKLKSGP